MATYRASSVFGNAVSGTEPSGAAPTPVIGDMLYVFCAAQGNTNAAATCADDRGGTYTAISQVLYNTSGDILTVFARDQLIIAVHALTVTVTIGAHTSVECCVLAVTANNRVGSNSIRNHGNTPNDVSAAPSAPFGAAALTGNMTVGVLGIINNTSVAPPGSWTERQEAQQGAGAAIELITRDSGFTGGSITWGAVVTGGQAVFVMELDGSVNSLEYAVDEDGAPAAASTDLDMTLGGFAAALAGSGINPIPYFYLACYDTLGVRNFWASSTVSFTDAPTPAGGASYVANTLVIEARLSPPS